MNRPTTTIAGTGTTGERGGQASVLTQIAGLQTLTHEELQERWGELYEAPPPAGLEPPLPAAPSGVPHPGTGLWRPA